MSAASRKAAGPLRSGRRSTFRWLLVLSLPAVIGPPANMPGNTPKKGRTCRKGHTLPASAPGRTGPCPVCAAEADQAKRDRRGRRKKG